MSYVHQVKCDQCQGEAAYMPEVPAYPDHWLKVLDIGLAGTVMEHPGWHFCSMRCLSTWAFHLSETKKWAAYAEGKG